ncbi:neprilysin-1-like [Dermacentor silvarum]|uniref:neprilysin-1-like n=1 Tax=Dermacentor silvarum TaxID=543639 RepID=UPI0021013B3D|nr:neprilysin-1-like [Dermacentor silvarum]
MLAKLLKSKSVGEKGLRHLVAWSVYTQLVQYTVPRLLVGRKKASDACYDHVTKAMKLALVSTYLHSIVKKYMLDQVNTMLANIRNVFRDVLKFSTWVTGDVRKIALRKLDSMKSYVGSPGQHLDAAFVEELYRPFPDVPKDGLFPTWIKAISLSSHYLWTDQTTMLYDETAVNAFYHINMNTIVVPTAIIQRPFYFYDGPLALSYGGLGGDMGQTEEVEMVGDWSKVNVLSGEGRVEGGTVVSTVTLIKPWPRHQMLDDTLDSENLADFVGVRIAYHAFTSLSHRERTLTLAGLNISAERLFFISHCVKSCARYSRVTSEYAPYRSRCIVPLMNMPEFSNAFGCGAGQPMNPKKKCNFWS